MTDADVDWAGEHVTLRFSVGMTEVKVAVAPETADRMIQQLRWATSEVRRFADHRASGKPNDAFAGTTKP
ncbi:hypothetical protein C8D87_114107 [Lentzea atacamensis]|uniref:Uncharacterized protein n=1 Tax=Lentzea atacamensis TaxID=531938 RepID=A0ABX9DZ42_9PSEU|nr:hypothetical protein [Lentzea atacamensis]RAS59495.1 hypothetical protein C8D87_114107 [Lentzea atacamensis]